jgi:hypothetical protein
LEYQSTASKLTDQTRGTNYLVGNQAKKICSSKKLWMDFIDLVSSLFFNQSTEELSPQVRQLENSPRLNTLEPLENTLKTRMKSYH